MSCVLRISGKKFNLDEFLNSSSLKPSVVFRKGAPRFKRNPKDRKIVQSAVNVKVSNASFNKLDSQIKGAIKFLRTNKKELRRITTSKKIKGELVLDFGVAKRDVAAQTDEFPAELLLLLGTMGIKLQVSHYPLSK